MELTRFIPKVPVRIVIGAQGFDTMDFAVDIREMLTQAGFPSDSDAGPWNVDIIPQLEIRRPLDNTNNPDVLIVGHGTNRIRWITAPVSIITNKMYANFIFEPNPRVLDYMNTFGPIGTNIFIYGAIKSCFTNIGINATWQSDQNIPTNDFFIFIPVKP